MENKKINVAELLKDCPEGMELDCTMWGNVVFDCIFEGDNYPIHIKRKTGRSEILTENGCYNFDLDAKCIIFPKGKDTWEGFVPPYEFKAGDIVINASGDKLFIYKGTFGVTNKFYVVYDIKEDKIECESIGWFFSRLATTEEQKKLFQKLKDKGYKWNDEKKCIERIHIPKFKVGDRIKSKVDEENIIFKIQEIQDNDYIVNSVFTWKLPIKNQEDFELVTNKFDINTLNPFNEVLVRNYNTDEWDIDLFGYYSRGLYHTTGRSLFRQCIPYKGNEYLRGTAEDCEEYYKTWE